MKLRTIEIGLPETEVKIEDMKDDFADFDLAVERSGVTRKFVAAAEETALDLAVATCQSIQKSNPTAIADLDGLIFITQTPDHILPGNSFLLIDQLDLSENVVNFDVNQACAGFAYGTLLAQSLMQSNTCSSIALICSDTYSKIISPQDRGTSLLFGDGCAVTLYSKKDGAYSVAACSVKNYAKYAQLFFVQDAAARDQYRSDSPSIEMQGAALLNLVSLTAPKFLDQFFQENNLTKDEIDLFVFHQASKIALDRLQEMLAIPDHKMYRNIENYGNTTSASIPIALHDALEDMSGNPPKRILVFGFGAGFSVGAVLLQAD